MKLMNFLDAPEKSAKKVNGDTALFFKQMGLWLLAQECSEEKKGPVWTCGPGLWPGQQDGPGEL